MLILILSQLLFGLCLPLNKVALGIMSPLLFVGIRLTVGGALLFGYGRTRGNRFRCITPKIFLALLPTILLGIVVKNLCKYHALCQTGVSHAALLLASTPLWAAFFSYAVLGEKLSHRQACAIALGITATVATTLPTCSSGTVCIWPELLILTAVIADAYSSVLLRQLVITHATPKRLIAGLRMLCGGAPLLLLAIATGNQQPYNLAGANGPVLLLALASGCFTHVIYLHLLSRHPAPLVALADLLGPLFAVLLSWPLLQEQPTWHTVAVGGFILSSMVLFNQCRAHI